MQAPFPLLSTASHENHTQCLYALEFPEPSHISQVTKQSIPTTELNIPFFAQRETCWLSCVLDRHGNVAIVILFTVPPHLPKRFTDTDALLLRLMKLIQVISNMAGRWYCLLSAVRWLLAVNAVICFRTFRRSSADRSSSLILSSVFGSSCQTQLKEVSNSTSIGPVGVGHSPVCLQVSATQIYRLQWLHRDAHSSMASCCDQS